MNRTELLSRVNRLAKRYHALEITPRELRRWVQHELLVGPHPKGRKRGQPPDWEWSREAYRRAVAIACLRNRGVQRYEAIRVHLWLGSAEGLTNRIRPAIISEFRRTKKRAFRKMATDPGPKLDEQQNAKRAENLIRQMGLANADLNSIAKSQILAVIDTMRFGVDYLPPDTPSAMLIKKFPAPQPLRIEPSALIEEMRLPQWLRSSDADYFGMFVEMAAGLAGDSESDNEQNEMPWAAEQILKRASGTVLIAARDFLRVCPWIMQSIPDFLAACVPAQKTPTAPAIPSYAPWLIKEMETPTEYLKAYVEILQLIYRQKKRGIEFARQSFDLVPILQKIIARGKSDPEIPSKLKSDNPFAPLVLLIKPKSELTASESKLRDWVTQRLWNYGLADFEEWRRRWSAVAN